MSIKSKDDEIFDGKSLSDIFEEIYVNSKDRKKDIDKTVEAFMQHIKHNKDVTFIGPVIKDLMHVSVQNDEQLVKMATIIQRLITNGPSTQEDVLGLDDKMKQQLREIAKQSSEPLDKSIPDSFDDIEGVMLGDETPEIEVITKAEENSNGRKQTD